MRHATRGPVGGPGRTSPRPRSQSQNLSQSPVPYPVREIRPMSLNRRQMLFATGAALIGAPAMQRALAADTAGPKKVLFYTKSSGFPHPVVTRKDGKLSHAERILTEIGKEHGFEVVASKDGRLFEPSKIEQ